MKTTLEKIGNIIFFILSAFMSVITVYSFVMLGFDFIVLVCIGLTFLSLMFWFLWHVVFYNDKYQYF